MAVSTTTPAAEAPTRSDRPPGTPTVREEPRGARRSPLHAATIVVIVLGLLLTAALSLGAASVHDHNENRLLRQRVREVGAALTASIGSVQSPLAAGAAIAETSPGDTSAFRKLMEPITKAKTPFQSVSLWRADAPANQPLVTVGIPPELTSQRSPQQIRQLFAGARGEPTFTIVSLLNAPTRRLGYVMTIPSKNARYVVYAETAALPKGRRARIDKNSAFSDLGYALYIGPTPSLDNLLASSTGGELLHGRRASDTVAFGNSKLLITMTPTKELGGSLLARLPWLFALFGVLITAAAALLVEWLIRRREQAEYLARENAQLYADQRTVAQTLQHSLLPQELPHVAGLDLATKYVAGVQGMDVGGDWYDLMPVDGHLVFVVGDVSGRGLHAATMMASLRYAIRAFASQGDGPATILSKLSQLVSISRDGHFATVLCGSIDIAGHRMTIANAGHPEPLLIDGERAEFVGSRIGVPVGVTGGPSYAEVTVDVPRNATLLAYTDGLVERRGESLDVGLQRLAAASVGADGSLEDLLQQVLSGTLPITASEDDTAVVALRWHD